MKNFDVLIVDSSIDDISILNNIIVNNCVNINSVKYSKSFSDGIELINSINKHIVFFEYKEQDPLIVDFLNLLKIREEPVIFISSETNHAINAFEHNAVDFVLKPIRVENVILAINKAMKKVELENLNKVNKILYKNAINNNFDFITVPSFDKIDFLKVKDILFCMADGKYTTFHMVGGKKIISSKNIGEYGKILDNYVFYRTHHAYIINIRHLICINIRGGYYCEFPNKIYVPVSKRRQDNFKKFINCRNNFELFINNQSVNTHHEINNYSSLKINSN